MTASRGDVNAALKRDAGLIHHVSEKVYRRAMAMKLSVEYDDVFQEMSIAYVNAFNAFDESKGVRFSTLYTTSAFRHANRLVDKESAQVGFSLDDEYKDNTPDNSSTPDVIVETVDAVEHLYGGLSSLAKTIVDFALNPPELLLREIEMKKAKDELTYELGTGKPQKMHLLRGAMEFVFALNNVGVSKQTKIRSEIKPISLVIG